MELYQYIMLAVAILASLKVFFAMVLPDLRRSGGEAGAPRMSGVHAGRACTLHR